MLSLLKFMSLYMWSWTEIGQIRLYYFRMQYSFLWGSWQQFISSKCRSRKNHYQFIFFYLVVTLKSQSFFSVIKGLEKGNFQNNAFLGWAGHKAVLYISWHGKGQPSLPPATCSVPLPYVDFAVSKVTSHVCPKTSQGGGDEQRERFSALPV